MEQLIFDFPKQFKEGIENAKHIKPTTANFNQVILSGMGASAWPAEILTTWLDLEIPLIVNKNYSFRQNQNSSQTLYICVSYSGETEETISNYKEAIKNNSNVAVVTSNGKLKKIAQENQTPLVEIPKNLVPRMATGYIFTAIYSILRNSSVIKNHDELILKMAKNLGPSNQQKQAKILAKNIENKIPLVYTSEYLKSLGFIWKTKFNENSKTPAFNNYFPELSHNELEGNSRQSFFYSIILKEENDHPKIQKAMDLICQILNDSGVSSEIIELKGGNLLEKIFNSILLADWASYYLAQIYGQDPLKTSTINKFKKKMNSQ